MVYNTMSLSRVSRSGLVDLHISDRRYALASLPVRLVHGSGLSRSRTPHLLIENNTTNAHESIRLSLILTSIQKCPCLRTVVSLSDGLRPPRHCAPHSGSVIGGRANSLGDEAAPCEWLPIQTQELRNTRNHQSTNVYIVLHSFGGALGMIVTACMNT